MAITLQPRGANPTNEAAVQFATAAEERLIRIGFSHLVIETLKMQPINAFSILAHSST